MIAKTGGILAKHTPASVLVLDPADVDEQLALFSDVELDDVIALTDNAALVNRLGRIERGRRTDNRQGQPLLPGSRSSQTEMNRRSEERRVAEWYDSTGKPRDMVEANGWKRLVSMMRAWIRESTAADPGAVAVFASDDWHSDDGRLHVLGGDFQTRLPELADGSVDLIVTDPPYPKDDLHLWNEAGVQAKRLLGPRGILFAWSGQLFLPQVLNMLTDAGLTYGWTFCLEMSSGSQSRIMGRHMIQAWKPIVAFTVGNWPSGEWGQDLIVGSGREKDLYAWQQDVSPARQLIERYAPPDGLVVDPFLGVGSFGVAARDLGRRFIGVEIDQDRFGQAVERLGVYDRSPSAKSLHTEHAFDEIIAV